MSAMLAVIVREGLHDRSFLSQHCTGFDQIEKALLDVPIADYAARADVGTPDVASTIGDFAIACPRRTHVL
jgi:anaerobic selenocysteine-containing dehydrogenase